MLGLGNEAKVLAVEAPNPAEAKRIENELRDQWHDSLTLDLMVSDSWIKLAMNRWRS
jgi:hypothetical protein